MKKTKKIKLTMVFTSIAINIVAIMAMVVCVYSTYLHPAYHPNWSYLGMGFPVILIINLCFIPFWIIFKPRMIFIPLLGLMSCAWAIRAYYPVNPFSSEEDANLKVISYNVMHMGDSTSKVAPCDNPILLYLMEQDADIVCLQEATHINYDRNFDTLRTVYPYIELSKSFGNIMAILSKYPILETINLEDSTISNRTFAYTVEMDDDTLLVINNHFESFKLLEADKEGYHHIIEHPRDSDTNERFDSLASKIILATKQRAKQVDYLNRYIRDCNYKSIILCGDFNDSPVSYTHNKMTEYLNDSYVRSGNGAGWSYNRSGLYFRIDNILVSDNIKSCKSKVDESIDTSDHYPIISWLKLSK